MIDIAKMAQEHAKLFPNATLESQIWKLDEEIAEYDNAIEEKEQIKELADIIIVCIGIYRWCPLVALSIKDFYNGCSDNAVEEEVMRKWQVNLNRKWEWNGKTYKHVGVDGNE